MPTYIKAGYWEKMQRKLKGWLNLDDFVTKFLTDVGAIKNSDIPTVIEENNIVTESDISDIITDNNIVISTDVSNIVALTQDEYDALETKVATTLYVIIEATTTTTTTVI